MTPPPRLTVTNLRCSLDEDKIEDILKIRLNLEKVERLENKLGKDIENGNGNGNYNNMDEESTSDSA